MCKRCRSQYFLAVYSRSQMLHQCFHKFRDSQAQRLNANPRTGSGLPRVCSLSSFRPLLLVSLLGLLGLPGALPCFGSTSNGVLMGQSKEDLMLGGKEGEDHHSGLASFAIVTGRIPVPLRCAVSGRFPEEQVCMAGGALHSGAMLSSGLF